METEFDVQTVKRGSDPAEKFLLTGRGGGGGDGTGEGGASEGGTGEAVTSEVGVIASVTKPFCGNCDRVRLTAEGQFRTCLFALDEFDMRAILRAEPDSATGHSTDSTDSATDSNLDDRLADAIAAAVGTKWAGHSIGQVHFIKPARTMSQVGG